MSLNFVYPFPGVTVKKTSSCESLINEIIDRKVFYHTKPIIVERKNNEKITEN